MTPSRVLGIGFIVCAYISLIPYAAFAQQTSAIAGVVRDGSGGVLPGVTVEAASPALIEKVRTVVTDDQGRYNIVDLRPGTYTVTFSLSGFNTLKREGIELTSGFTAAINAELPVGSLEETITVTGESPLVDTQNVRKQTILSAELLDLLPTSKANQKQKQVRDENPFMLEMREEACEPRAFVKAGTQKLLGRNGAEADERGGECMAMKNSDAGERGGEK